MLKVIVPKSHFAEGTPKAKWTIPSGGSAPKVYHAVKHLTKGTLSHNHTQMFSFGVCAHNESILPLYTEIDDRSHRKQCMFKSLYSFTNV